MTQEFMTQEFFDKIGQRMNQWKLNKDRELGYVMSDKEAIERFISLLKHSKQIMAAMEATK